MGAHCGRSRIATRGMRMQILPEKLPVLVAGDLKRKHVGKEQGRCFVWAEPELVDKAAEEFDEMERWLAAAEELAGLPYQGGGGTTGARRPKWMRKLCAKVGGWEVRGGSCAQNCPSLTIRVRRAFGAPARLGRVSAPATRQQGAARRAAIVFRFGVPVTRKQA
eukprot:gene58177-biopygen48609